MTKTSPEQPAVLDRLQEASRDPVEFARLFMHQDNGQPLIPHEGQIELLRHVKKITVCCCGRQWGKSVAMAIYGTWYAVTHNTRQVYVIAPTVDQARIIFNEIAHQFRQEPLSALVVGKIHDYPFPKIKLANGTEIHARGANSPQFLRGKKCHLAIVDEAAFCKDTTLTDVVEPMLTVTGKQRDSGLLMISTPFGLGAFYNYYQAAQDGSDPDAISFHFTSESNPHADKQYLERVKRRYSEESITWRTEYMAEFVDDDLAVFPAKLIKWAYENYPYGTQFPIPPEPEHRYVMGVDLANVRDYFVAATLDVTNPQAVPLVNLTRMQKKGYNEYKRVVRAEHERYNHPRTLIDATSLGESVVEDLGDIQAEGYKFSSQSKFEAVSELSRMLQEHRLLIPYDPLIISEFRNFQYEFTASKNVKMEAKEGHDDIVMALALAAHLALIPRSLGFFRGVDLQINASKVVPMKKRPNYDPFADLFAFD